MAAARAPKNSSQIERDLESKENPRSVPEPGVCYKSLAMTYSRVSKPTLPSALGVFTSEFGMGSGGSRPL